MTAALPHAGGVTYWAFAAEAVNTTGAERAIR